MAQRIPGFEFVDSFPVVVPNEYVHRDQLDDFRVLHRSEFYSYNDAITDRNFFRATTVLTPGRRFIVGLYEITAEQDSEDCLDFLFNQHAILVGAHGATLAYEQGKEKLLKGYWHASFDRANALHGDADGPLVPIIGRAESGSQYWFNLGLFTRPWLPGGVILCFRNIITTPK